LSIFTQRLSIYAQRKGFMEIQPATETKSSWAPLLRGSEVAIGNRAGGELGSANAGQRSGNRQSEVFLNDEFKNAWKGMDPFTEAFRLEGEIFRSVKTRKTFRFELNGKSYFAKIHHGVGWGEIVKNMLQFKRPVLGARNEYEAIRRLEKLGVATMKVAAFGERGKNPARIQSFIITEELVNTVSLEEVCCEWKNHPPPFALKLALIRYLADVSRTLHGNGVNHRDYYICHFLLDLSSVSNPPRPLATPPVEGNEKGGINDPLHGRGAGTAGRVFSATFPGEINGIKASLIDLHRAQLRRSTPRRWVVKDVAGLWFSAMDIGLTPRDRFRFMKIYSGKTLRETARQDAGFWRAVMRTARQLYEKEQRRPL